MHRDKSGKEVSEEELRAAKDAERKAKEWVAPEWAGGVKQQRDAEARRAEEAAQAALPFARSRCIGIHQVSVLQKHICVVSPLRRTQQAAQGAPPSRRRRALRRLPAAGAFWGSCKVVQVLKAVTLLYNVETDERKAEARHVEQAAPRCPLPAVGVSQFRQLLKKSNDRAAQVPPCPMPPAGRHSASCICIVRIDCPGIGQSL